MHETPAEVDELQALLDRSYESAGPHLLSIHSPEWRASATELVELLDGMCVLDLATVNSKGEPFVGAVDGFFWKGRWWFGTSPESVRARHIARRPAVSAAHTRGEELSVVVHGTAVPLDKGSELGQAFRDFGVSMYGEEIVAEQWPTAPYWHIEPRRMYALRPKIEGR